MKYRDTPDIWYELIIRNTSIWFNFRITSNSN